MISSKALSQQLRQISDENGLSVTELKQLLFRYYFDRDTRAYRETRKFCENLRGVISGDKKMDADVFEYLMTVALRGYDRPAAALYFRIAYETGLYLRISESFDGTFEGEELLLWFGRTVAELMERAQLDAVNALRVTSEFLHIISPGTEEKLIRLMEEMYGFIVPETGERLMSPEDCEFSPLKDKNSYTETNPRSRYEEVMSDYGLKCRFERIAAHFRRGEKQLAPQLGDMYYNGTGTPRSYEKAFEMYLHGAVDRDEHSLYMLAECLLNGQGTEEDPEEAARLLRQLGEGGSTEAYMLLADISLSQEKVSYYKNAVAQGSAEAALKLGEIFRDGIDGVKPSVKKSAAAFELAAGFGSTEGMTEYGRLFLRGSIKADEGTREKAFGMLLDAAGLGSGEAMYELALLCEEGKLAAKDEILVRRWAGDALLSGYPFVSVKLDSMWGSGRRGAACLDLLDSFMKAEPEFCDSTYFLDLAYEAFYYSEEYGDTAAELCRRSAALGSDMALYRLGMMYRDGIAVKRSAKKALSYFKAASEHSLPEAMIAAAELLKQRGEREAADTYIQKARIPEDRYSKYSELSYEDTFALITELRDSPRGTEKTRLLCAAKYFRYSCEERKSRANTAVRHLVGIYGDKLGSEAMRLKFLIIGADMGFPDMQLRVGEYFLDPYNDDYDRVKGQSCLLRAAEGGMERAAELLWEYEAEDE